MKKKTDISDNPMDTDTFVKEIDKRGFEKVESGSVQTLCAKSANAKVCVASPGIWRITYETGSKILTFGYEPLFGDKDELIGHAIMDHFDQGWDQPSEDVKISDEEKAEIKKDIRGAIKVLFNVGVAFQGESLVRESDQA